MKGTGVSISPPRVLKKIFSVSFLSVGTTEPDLFEIRDHRIFPNYPHQLFVKLFIDFNLTELGIGDWQPLTPRLESSLAFQRYSNSSRDVQQWLALRDTNRNSL